MAKGFENDVFKNLLENGYYFNSDIRHFPKEQLNFWNLVGRHIEIYNLIKEYVDLYTDGKNASEETAALIKERMKTIAHRLAENYYVVTKDELK